MGFEIEPPKPFHGLGGRGKPSAAKGRLLTFSAAVRPAAVLASRKKPAEKLGCPMTLNLFEPEGDKAARESPFEPSPEIRAVLDSAAKVGRLSLSLVDESLRELTEPAGVAGFCREANFRAETSRLCASSRRFGLDRAFSLGEPFAYFCPFGLMEMVVPIASSQASSPFLRRAVIFSQAKCANSPPGLVSFYRARSDDEAPSGEPKNAQSQAGQGQAGRCKAENVQAGEPQNRQNQASHGQEDPNQASQNIADQDKPGSIQSADSPSDARLIHQALSDPVLKAFHDAAPILDYHEVLELALLLNRTLPPLMAGEREISEAFPERGGQARPRNGGGALDLPRPGIPLGLGITTREAAGLRDCASFGAGQMASQGAGRSALFDSSEGFIKAAALPDFRLNPAFLVSAVSSIANLAVIEGAWKANRMAILLVEHLKSAEAAAFLDFRPLSDELADIERYLAFQRLRYGDLLSYRIVSPPGLADLKVPADALMPAVERAVFCGLATGGEKLEVEVSTRRSAMEVVVEIGDNLTAAVSPLEELNSLATKIPSEMRNIVCRFEALRECLRKLSPSAEGPTVLPGHSGGSICRLRLPALAAQATLAV